MLMVEGSREVGLDAVISYGRGMRKMNTLLLTVMRSMAS